MLYDCPELVTRRHRDKWPLTKPCLNVVGGKHGCLQECAKYFIVDVDCIPACASFDGSAGRGFAFVPASDRPVKF